MIISLLVSPPDVQFTFICIKEKREKVDIIVLEARLDVCCESAVVDLFQEFYLALNGELVPPHKLGYGGN